MTSYALRDLDVFYISFDEPNSDANWTRVLQQCQHAKRIHGVIGFDRAHKACAIGSTTDRFVTIDGDNWLNDNALNNVIDDTGVEDACFSFKSRNVINGLEYGNGGVKVWNRQVLLSSNTHEQSSTTDFCWDIRYFQIDVIASTTVTNCSPYQAWRAGYREGVKMSYIDGMPIGDFKRDWHMIWKGNLSRLAMWCSVGRDVDNGIWAMLGARQGLYELVSGSIPNTMINDYQWFPKRFQDIAGSDADAMARWYAERLGNEYDFVVPELDAQMSAWMKMVYVNPSRHGLMR